MLTEYDDLIYYKLVILSLFLKYGIGTTKDTEKAIYWWKKAAEQGDEAAKAELRKLGL